MTRGYKLFWAPCLKQYDTHQKLQLLRNTVKCLKGEKLESLQTLLHQLNVNMSMDKERSYVWRNFQWDKLFTNILQFNLWKAENKFILLQNIFFQLGLRNLWMVFIKEEPKLFSRSIDYITLLWKSYLCMAMTALV